MTSFFLREALFQTAEQTEAILILFNAKFLFAHRIISIMGDGGKAFLSVLSVLWTEFSCL